MERRLGVLVELIGVSPSIQQRLADVKMAFLCCQVSARSQGLLTQGCAGLPGTTYSGVFLSLSRAIFLALAANSSYKGSSILSTELTTGKGHVQHLCNFSRDIAGTAPVSTPAIRLHTCVILRWPRAADLCSGVAPCLSATSTSAPAASSIVAS